MKNAIKKARLQTTRQKKDMQIYMYIIDEATPSEKILFEVEPVNDTRKDVVKRIKWKK